MGDDRHVDASSPAICADGIIYFGTNIGDGAGGEIIALNPDGTERWRKMIANDWVESSPSIGEDGTVYIGSSSSSPGGNSYGYLHAFNRADLSADADGPHYGLISEAVQFNGTGIGGYKPYTEWHWDFGDGDTSTERNPLHTYSTDDNYTVTLTVTDVTGNSSEGSTFAWIQDGNDPPEIPIIIGPKKRSIKELIGYKFNSSDPEGTPIWYFIEWGDGTDSGWIGPYNSGEQIGRDHKWYEWGRYTIRCKTKDPYDDKSEWGELKVTMPKNHNMGFMHWLNKYPILQKFLGIIWI